MCESWTLAGAMGVCLLRPEWRLGARQHSGLKNSPRALESAALRDMGGEQALAIHRLRLTPLSGTSAHGFSSGPEVEGQLRAWIGWRDRWGIGL